VPSSTFSIPIEILEPAQRGQTIKNFPVAVGLVFEDGALSATDSVCLKDSLAREVPLEAEATGWWDREKTRIKWLLLRFRADTDLSYVLSKGIGGTTATAPLATQSGDTIIVDTGPLRVVHDAGSSQLFDSVELNGAPMVSAVASPHVLILDQNGVEEPTAIASWYVSIAESSADRVVLRAGGNLIRVGTGEVAARLDLRYEFFRGESFVRLNHTMVWMSEPLETRAKQISLKLGLQQLAWPATVFSGKSDYTAESTGVALYSVADSAIVVQEDASHYSLRSGTAVVESGSRHGGWFAVQGADGRGLSVALRHLWQMNPKALRVEQGELAIDLWPAEAVPMGFDYRSLWPDDFYYADEWSLWSFSKDTDPAGNDDHVASEYYGEDEFSGKGVARTHEMLLHFTDPTATRTAGELNSILQHPLVLRQDPQWALKVPVMGLTLSPVNTADHPDLENAVETIGKRNTARWEEMHDYGFWRFGMLRWWSPSAGLYRRFDGTQYGLQIIPWLLFLRGGSREFFEEGAITSQYAMDVCTNHASTNDAVPSGYQAQAAVLPFPVLYPTWASHATKRIKLHFLKYYYHLTGDPRARETIDEVIAGAKWDAKTNHATLPWPDLNPAVSAREVFNVNTFWADAYEESWDDEVKSYAERWMANTLQRQYSATLRAFRFPDIYLFDGIANYHGVFGNHTSDGRNLESTVLEYLQVLGFPDLQDGGVVNFEQAIGALWAYQRWGDPRMASILFDLARTIADVVPSIDPSTAKPSDVKFTGQSLLRTYLMPMLAGLSAAHQAGLREDRPVGFTDTYMTVYDPNLDSDASDNGTVTRATAYLEPAISGDLLVTLHFQGTWGQEFKPISVGVFDDSGAELVTTILQNPGWPDISQYLPANWSRVSLSLTIPSTQQGARYRVVLSRDHTGLDGSFDYTKTAHNDAKNNDLTFLVLAEAKIVYEATTSSADTFVFRTTSAAPAVVYLRTTSETATLWTRNATVFTLRDAKTWEVLYRAPFSGIGGAHYLSVGKDRELALVADSAGLFSLIAGLSPYVSPKPSGWFDPKSNP